MQQAWLEAPEADFLAAEIRVGWTPTSLLVHADLPDRDIFTQATASNQRMWELGDVFEIFLQAADRSDYVELHVTPPNLRLQLHFPSAEAADRSDYLELHVTPPNLRLQLHFPSAEKPATHLDDGAFASWVKIDSENQRWTVHAEIPARLVSGRDSIHAEESWHFSFSRYDASRDGRPPVLSSTSPHRALNFHRIHEWGNLIFG